VYLTPGGAALRTSIEAVMRTVEELSFAHMTPDEKILLRRLLLQVYDNIR
jgi:DNA-binding MarR family transcriptional regulator